MQCNEPCSTIRIRVVVVAVRDIVLLHIFSPHRIGESRQRIDGRWRGGQD
jgi:hypothetical protein